MSLKPGDLPKPKTCPVCGGELEERVQVIKMLRRVHPGQPWQYTGPGAPKGKKLSRTRTVERPIYVCARCSVRVQLHRDRPTWPEKNP